MAGAVDRQIIKTKSDSGTALPSPQDQYFYAFKQAKRRDDDIAIVNIALNVTFEPSSKVIRDFHVAYGGMAPMTVQARKTRETLIGK